MATQVAAAANLAFQVAAMAATGIGTAMKIEEGKEDYRSEIARMEEAKAARERVMENEIARAKDTGVAALTEEGRAGTFETRMALMGVEQVASSAEARMGAGNIRAAGTAAAAAQQQVDIAYAGAQRQAEAAASRMTVGGMQLRNQLQSGREQKSLLTMEYEQNLAEQRRKLKDLTEHKAAMVAIAVAGGMAGLSSTFYQQVQSGVWKKKEAV